MFKIKTETCYDRTFVLNSLPFIEDSFIKIFSICGKKKKKCEFDMILIFKLHILIVRSHTQRQSTMGNILLLAKDNNLLCIITFSADSIFNPFEAPLSPVCCDK